MVNTIWKKVFLIMCSHLKENARYSRRFPLILRITKDYTLQILCVSPHNVGNEEGKIQGLPLNRAVYDEETHEMIDIVSGDFLVVYAPAESEHYESLPENYVKEFKKKFKNPENFFRMNDRIVAIPYKPETEKDVR